MRAWKATSTTASAPRSTRWRRACRAKSSRRPHACTHPCCPTSTDPTRARRTGTADARASARPPPTRPMTSSDMSTPVPALPGRARTFRWRFHAARLGLVIVLLAAAAFLPTGEGALERLRYREGDIARERVVAPTDFRVQKDDVTLRREQEEAALAVPPVFVVDQRARTDAAERWSAFQEHALAVVSDPAVGPRERADKLKVLGVTLDGAAAEARSVPGRARRALTELGPWLIEALDAGVVDEKRGGFILGYRNITLRDGDLETTVPATEFMDRREALDRIERHAR